MVSFDKENARLVIGSLIIPYPTRQRLIQDLIANAISYGIAILVSGILHRFFAVRSFRNLWGIVGKKKGKVMIDGDTYAWIDWTLTFIIGLFVFTIMEHVMEHVINWYKEQKEKEKEERNV
ncbi:MAG: hypothetical protein K0R51_1128 [Cytophagaceae bacterium]|jgi:hypothetical protein|nr:hypothetical protein [Cytophagaceae bacterium]